MLEKLRKKRFNRIISAHEDLITSSKDLICDKPPSMLCLLLGLKYSKLFDTVSDKKLRRQIAWRDKLHPIFKKLISLFITQNQVIENREALRAGMEAMEPDCGITLPDEPVIWMINHRFKDDAAASLKAIYRHAYMVFGSVPQFYNTMDGVAAYLNGVIIVNRKVKATKDLVIPRSVQAIQQGVDLAIWPEAGWNKTPNVLLTKLWPGIYKIAKETGAKIVPIVHYVKEPSLKLRGNDIHTVIDDPVSVENMEEKDALEYLRDIEAGWYYLMMERYGKSTREDALRGENNANTAWELQLRERIAPVERYDEEIEKTTDYRPKDIAWPEHVWDAVAGIKNITPYNASHVAYACNLVEQAHREDFQRRF